jgi:sodium transport system ATP-binding protein
MSALELKNISKSFLDKTAVEDVSFKVEYGEVLALLGSNGAGKTTTLNMIAGFLMPSSGEVLVNGQWNHAKHNKEIKNTIGYLTSNMRLYEKFSIRECLQFLGKLRDIEKKQIKIRIEELCELFEIGDYVDKKFQELSSGQKQRSLIAATLLHDPKILILDEITASLDVPTARLIMDFLKKEKSKGKAILFSTHILTEAEYLSDQMAIIHDGRIMDQCSASDFMAKHNSNNMTDAFCEAVLKYKSENAA